MSSEIFAQLSSRRPGLEQLEPGWRVVDDVLAGKIKQRSADGWSSAYLPKGRLEPAGEYSQRVEPRSKKLRRLRKKWRGLGALFKQRMQIEPHPQPLSSKERGDAAARFARFLERAGRRSASFEDLAVQAACLAQTHGFCAALIDRDPLVGQTFLAASPATDPADKNVCPTISMAEANARELGRPYIALYAAPQILDWDFGSDGRLAWVKFGEQELWRPSWDAEPEMVNVFRIVDREAIHVFRVRNGDRSVPATADKSVLATNGSGLRAPTTIAHGFGEVPVVFLHPFPAQDGIGRSLLLRAAEADIAATRVLSDLVWDLYLLGNPILTLKTLRDENEQKKLCLGATRYIPLRNSRPGIEDAEELKFVQLDATGIELLFKAHGLFSAQARQAGSGGEEASAVPLQQTGIAQAWRFKTGEERILFMLARALEPFLSSCLSLALKALTSPLTPLLKEERGTEVVVRLPDSFDVAPESEQLSGAEHLLEIAEKFGQTELAKAALARIEASLGILPAATREALRKEREALKLSRQAQQ